MMVLFFPCFILLSTKTYASDVSSFADVPQDHYAYSAIYELRELSVIHGTGKNQFGLGQTITRAEFITLLSRLENWQSYVSSIGTFKDVQDPNSWYFDAVEKALQFGVIEVDNGFFRPQDPITREEMAGIIIKAMGYNCVAKQLSKDISPFQDVSSNIGYITIAKDLGIITGMSPSSFNPKDTAKREDAAVMLIRMQNTQNTFIQKLHGFYALQSSSQIDYLLSFDSISFGWGRIFYNSSTHDIEFTTQRSEENRYGIPDGYKTPVSAAKKNDIPIQLMIFAENTDFEDQEGASSPLLSTLLKDENKSKEIAMEIAEYIRSNKAIDFEGVTIDFEGLKGISDKNAFTHFLEYLRSQLKMLNKSLFVTVPPIQHDSPSSYDGYDYKAIGQIADQVILMAHDYNAKYLSQSDMKNGVYTTPLTPIHEVYYALQKITDPGTGVPDTNKITLQLSFASAQWKQQKGTTIHSIPYTPTYEAIYKRMVNCGTVQYNKTYENPYFTYYNAQDQTNNVIWYEDERSIEAKIHLANSFGIHNFSLWRLGTIPNFDSPASKPLYLKVWDKIQEQLEN